MSIKTNISWATSTGNPRTGCAKVSPGCKNCYMFAWKHRMGEDGNVRARTKAFWKDALKWNKTPMVCPNGSVPVKGAPGGHGPYVAGQTTCCECGSILHRARIFPSLCDWLDEEIPIEWLADFRQLIYDTPNLDWLLLTKRPENFHRRIDAACEYNHGETYQSMWTQGEPPDNVWIGASVENQEYADKRIPELLKIPARVRFLSVEPMLGKIDLLYSCFNGVDSLQSMHGINWVIFGGESGPGHRPCDPQWIEDGVSQCIAANVPVFVKQDSGSKPGMKGRLSDAVWAMKQFPKTGSGSV